MEATLLVEDRIGRLNQALLAFRVGLYAVIVVGLAATGQDAALAIVAVAGLTFVPALPVRWIRPNRIEVGVATSLLVEFVLWFRFGDVVGLTVLPLLSIAVAGLFSTRRVGVLVGLVAIALQAIQIASHVVGRTGHARLADPPTGNQLLSETVLLVVVALAFLGLGELLRGYQRDLAERILEKARLDRVIAEKDQLIDSIAHELRTPLTAVVGFSELIWRESDDLSREDLVTVARSVAAESNRLRRVIDNVVVSARAQNGGIAVDPAPIDVGSVVDEAWSSAAEDGWTIDVRGDAVVKADERRLRHLLDNLIDNALRHGSTPIRISITASSGSAVIDVGDAGPGPGPDAERLFDRYDANRSEHRPDNLGLGLPTARALAESMGGSLGWEDGWFRLRLPLVSSPVRDSSGSAAEPSPTA